MSDQTKLNQRERVEARASSPCFQVVSFQIKKGPKTQIFAQTGFHEWLHERAEE